MYLDKLRMHGVWKLLLILKKTSTSTLSFRKTFLINACQPEKILSSVSIKHALAKLKSICFEASFLKSFHSVPVLGML